MSPIIAVWSLPAFILELYRQWYQCFCFQNGYYANIVAFHNDMLLVKSNCETYNPPKHPARLDCEEVFTFYLSEYQKLMEKWQRVSDLSYCLSIAWFCGMVLHVLMVAFFVVASVALYVPLRALLFSVARAFLVIPSSTALWTCLFYIIKLKQPFLTLLPQNFTSKRLSFML